MVKSRTLGILAVLAASALVAGCSSPDPEPPAPLPSIGTESAPEVHPDASKPADEEPTSEQERTALEAARIMTTWNPQEDMTATHAELRARELMTKARAKEVRAPERPASSAVWNAAAEAKATSKPTAVIERANDDRGVTVRVTWTWNTEDGPAGVSDPEGERGRLYHYEFDGERIAAYTYEQAGRATTED